MASLPAGAEIERLIQLLSKLPGLGPRSARRAALVLLKKRETLLEPLGAAMRDAAAAIRVCEVCGNLDTTTPCSLCRDPRRDTSVLCVVEDVADLWALERAGVFKGKAQIETAEISGHFEGDLVVTQKMTIHSTGRVFGNIRYGQIEIARGGIISGQIDALADSAAAPEAAAEHDNAGGESSGVQSGAEHN